MNCCLTMSGWPTRFWNLSDMSRSKKLFAAFALVFFLLLAYVVYDISQRTTFPGRPTDTEQNTPAPAKDSVSSDTTRVGDQ